ncbi:MAG: VPLPA-CTERM sorting domain-containing protein [Pseudomonadota bacterium]
MIRSLISAVFLATLATASHSATVTNGSFEDIGAGALNGNGWNHFLNIPGWTGDPNVEVQSNSTLGSSVNTPFGDRYAELDTNQDAGIYQDIFLDAGKYMLNFWYSPRVNASPTTTNDMDYSISMGATDLLLGSINGAPNLAYQHGVFTEVTGRFAVESAGLVRLAFSANGGSFYNGCGNCGALIDNVSISAVPLPAAGWMLLAGFGGLVAMRRRSKS